MTDETRTTDAAEIQRILEARAAQLARPSQVDDDQGDVRSLVVVGLGDERYGIDLAYVREIAPEREITALPATPPFWLGLMNVRGNLVPILDLRRYLGQGASATSGVPDAQTVLVVGAGMTIALRVDEVVEVRDVRHSDIGPSLVESVPGRPRVHAGLTNDLLAVLDLDALLADPALQVHDEVD